MQPSLEEFLIASIRTIPDYPKPGILFRDITTLLGNARAFRRAVDELVHPYAGQKIDKIAGIEARGFILGGAIAHQISAGFIPIRKKGKLPHETVRVAYSLEYGLDEMEMHKDAVAAGEKVILVDDLIATGGTAEGAVKLLRQIGADIVAACFVIDLPDLGGRSKARGARRAGPDADRLRRALRFDLLSVCADACRATRHSDMAGKQFQASIDVCPKAPAQRPSPAPRCRIRSPCRRSNRSLRRASTARASRAATRARDGRARCACSGRSRRHRPASAI